MALDILIVDDEADIRSLIAGILQDEGHATREAGNSDDAIGLISDRRPSVVVLDVWLQGSRLDGLELLDSIKAVHPDLPVIVISGHGTIETAVTAIQRGAFHFIEKPFQAEHLLLNIRRATEAERLRRENEELRERAGLDTELTGNSGVINTVRSLLRKVANTGSRVMISGPSGSGKEIAARLIHQWSTRHDAPFSVLSAASLVPERFEAELFGVERDGQVIKTGVFEQAHNGTLFLDEIGDMPLVTQGRILRVLIEQAFQRIGGTRMVHVDVRVISSTSRDLRDDLLAGRFREDLFYRLNVVPIGMPALVERREDIPALVEHFLRKLASERGRKPLEITAECLAALQSYDWPGNVRQLRNIMERTLILAASEATDRIEAAMLPPELTQEPARLFVPDVANSVMSAPLREAREAFEREYLKLQIRRFSGNISRTAIFIGMERSALHRKLKALGLASLDRDGEGEDEGA